MKFDIEFNKKNIIFMSDLHLLPDSLDRISTFIDTIDKWKNKFDVLFFLGDLFDFWIDYKFTFFKHYIDIISFLKYLKKSDKKIYLITGNHDFLFNSSTNEFINKIFFKDVSLKLDSLSVYLTHGDEINYRDYKYLFLKKLLQLKITKNLIYVLHPDLSWFLASNFSKLSRKATNIKQDINKSIQYRFMESLSKKGYNVLIFGHIHKLKKEIYHFNSNKNILSFSLGYWGDRPNFLFYNGKFKFYLL